MQLYFPPVSTYISLCKHIGTFPFLVKVARSFECDCVQWCNYESPSTFVRYKKLGLCFTDKLLIHFEDQPKDWLMYKIV